LRTFKKFLGRASRLLKSTGIGLLAVLSSELAEEMSGMKNIAQYVHPRYGLGTIHDKNEEKDYFTEGQKRKFKMRRQIERACEIAESNLPPGKKLMYLLAFRHGYPYADIADLVGIKEENVLRRIQTLEKEILAIIERRKNVVEEKQHSKTDRRTICRSERSRCP